MYRPTLHEVNLRHQEQLREAEYRRLTARARTVNRQSNRILRTFGLRAAIALRGA